MSPVVPSVLPRIWAAVFMSLLTLSVLGCAHPLGVRVVDSRSGAPVAGARVTRYKVCGPPFLVVGPILPVEECKTDDQGFVQLKDGREFVRVEAAGFASASRGIGDEDAEAVVLLDRVGNDAQPLGGPLN